MKFKEHPQKKPFVICLMGPTASGKTDLAVKLCQHLPCDIISVDSALVYRGMDIGTAKPTAEELAVTPHRLIDIRNPADPYSAAQFCIDALKEIESIIEQGRIPLLVGGTMLYFRALQQGLSALPEANPEIRKDIEAEAIDKGWNYLHQQLKQIDPESAKKIHSNDPQRIQRALEVYRITGEPMSKLTQENKPKLPYPCLNIALAPKDRAVLHQRIAERFEQMLTQGFFDEVRALYQRGDLNPDLPAMRAVGYRQAWEYLTGEITEKEMIEKAIIATRQLAKRQLTWLRSWSEIHWFDSLDECLLERVLGLIVKS